MISVSSTYLNEKLPDISYILVVLSELYVSTAALEPEGQDRMQYDANESNVICHELTSA